MISYEDLNNQNHKITELSNVVSILIKDRSICDSETCSTLFYNYMDLVNIHMTKVDSSMYVDLLGQSSTSANQVANNFMSGSQEIKRIMKTYARKWFDRKKHALSVGSQHDTFIKDTDDLFEMVLNRIQDETENLYPMVRKISNG